MTDTTYNGWTNYETWCAALWLGEDEYWRDRAEEIMREEDNDASAATAELAREMEEVYEDDVPATAGMYADLLSASMSRINWYEIAGHYIEDVDVDAPDEIEE